MREDSREHRQVLLKGEALLFLRERRRAIGQCHDAEALFVACARGRLDTAVCQESGNSQRLYPARTQNEIEIGAGEGIESAFSLDDNIVRTRRK